MIGCHARHWRHRGAQGLVLAGVLACLGCETPGRNGGGYDKLGSGPGNPAPAPIMIDPAKVPTRGDIVAIHQYWPNFPWLTQSDRVVGFRVTTYFVSGETEKGAFVPGTIFAWVYTLGRGEDGTRTREIAHVWEFDQTAAMSYRVRKEAIGGYFYGFMLAWPANLDLDGKLIEIEFGYERRDKSVVTSAARRFRVPLLGEDARKPRKAEP